jgi:hypothetical protein
MQACSSGRCRIVGGSTGAGLNSIPPLWVFTSVVPTMVAFPRHPPYGRPQGWKPLFKNGSTYGMGLSLLGAPLNTVKWYKQALDIVALASFAVYSV